MEQESKKAEFMNLIINNENLINKICNLYTSNNADFEDLRQDVVYQLWKSFPTFRSESKFQTWMYRVALNTALHFRRGLRDKPNELKQWHANIADQISDSPAQDNSQLLHDSIKSLPELDRAIVILYLEKCSYDKISEITGISEKNVGVKLHRIKETLRKKLNTNS